MRRSVVLGACAAALAVAVLLGVSLGSGSASPIGLLRGEAAAREILLGYRLPRVALGAVAGAGLAAVGAAFQAVLRNPLAEPYILGVSGGSALGAALAIVFGLGGSGLLAAAGLPAAAFAGGVAATALVWALTTSGRARGASVLLAGVAVNSIATASITALEALADPARLQSLLFWLLGYLDVPSGAQLAFVGAYVLGGLAILVADAARMNLLALGDEAAMTLGVDVRRLERRTLFACAAVVGAIVSVTGLIGFVGLVVPQAMRRLVGPDLRSLLPASALAGSALLVICDLAVRLASRAVHTEIPVGAVTALVGGPIFLILLGRRRTDGTAL